MYPDTLADGIHKPNCRDFDNSKEFKDLLKIALDKQPFPDENVDFIRNKQMEIDNE